MVKAHSEMKEKGMYLKQSRIREEGGGSILTRNLGKYSKGNIIWEQSRRLVISCRGDRRKGIQVLKKAKIFSKTG